MAETRIESLDAAQAAQSRLKAQAAAAPAPYQDHYMPGGDVAATDAAEAVDEAAQPDGFRTWLVESRIGFGSETATGQAAQRGMAVGQRLAYRRETLDYGNFDLQIDARHTTGSDATLGGIGSLGYASSATSNRFTLRNSGLPLGDGRFVDSALGDIHSELTPGLTRNYRLSLGSASVRGASVRVFEDGTDLRAGFGERGDMAGGPYPGFEKSQGTLGWIGVTRRIDSRWTASAQIDQANNIPATDVDPVSGLGTGSRNVTSWASSLAYGGDGDGADDGPFKLRATLLGSHTSSADPSVPSATAQGLSLEASLRTGRYKQEFGVYSGQPDLFFGDYALATGTRTAYWRVDHSAGRMSWGAGVDLDRAAADATFTPVAYRRTGVSGNVQYQLDRNSSLGGSLSVYRLHYDYAAGDTASADDGSGSRSFNGNLYYQTRFFDWPASRFSLTAQGNHQIVYGSNPATGQELQWEQDWIGGRFDSMRPQLTTTLGYARDQSNGAASYYPTASVQMRWWMDDSFNMSANLRYSSQSGQLYTSQGLSGSFTADKALSDGWHVGVAIDLNQARNTVLPTSALGPQVYRSNEKTVSVYLRWDGSAGKAYALAGMRHGTSDAGSGRIDGRVFLDANRDGLPQSGEGGANHVEVLLDGRDPVTTDRDGRFEFPLVSPGHHQLSLTPDTVPLPWGAADEGGVSVDVPLRGRVAALIPVVKVGE